MADDSFSGSYPQRSELIADMCGLLKAARRPLTDEWKHFDLDADGWKVLERLTSRLERHLSFEHLERDQLRAELREAVRNYRSPASGKRPGLKEYATQLLDGLAQTPMRRIVYLGVRHLKLANPTVVGDVRFLMLSENADLAESFAWFRDLAPEMVCEVEAIGGSGALVLERARKKAERALALVRQQILFGFMAKIYLDQVMFGLDGRYSWREGADLARAGWWRDPKSIPMDLTEPATTGWRSALDGLSADYLAVAPGLRERIDACADWLDVAARSDRWPIIIPATFSAMETILIPEKAGLKAAVVTVRSVAVHIAVSEPFSNPGKVVAGYQLRSDLVHGTPTSDVLDTQATEFAEFTRHWAFDVFRYYLRLAKAINADGITAVMHHLDGGPCEDACAWLEEHGGTAVVAEYRDVLQPRNERVAGTAG